MFLNQIISVNTFDSLEAATRARENLNGADIYSGCCTLKIDYAKVSMLFTFLNYLSLLVNGFGISNPFTR